MADKILSKIKDGNGDKFIFRDDAAVHTVDSALSTTSTNPVQNKVVKSALDGKQDTLSTQTAYTSKGSATKVPQITTNSLGQVTGITEVTITQPDISGKEDSSNKVSSWSSTTNDTHYPSEKLVKDSLDAKAPLASPTFTGTPKAPTAAAGTNTTQIATTAFVKTAVDNAIAGVADALIYKGTIAGGSTGAYGALTAAANKGDLYKVSTAGKIDGVKVEVGDMLICNTDNTAAATSSNYSTVAANWDFIQANIDGYVLGPGSSVDAHVATFDGTAGNTIKDSGYTIAANVPSGAVFTDTKVTSSGNHYTPATASGSDKSASATGATAAWGIDVVQGVTLNTDGKGHVTGISVTSGKIPSNPNTDTKVKATAKTDDVNYKILATASASPTSGNATEAVYDADITLNPSTNTIAANISGDAATASAAKSGSTLATTIAGKQDALTAQTAYSAKGSATKVPQITTNSLGQVTGITEVTITGVTPASHTHGNIANGGTLTDTAAAAAGNDYVVIRDADNAKIQTSTIKGTDVADAVTKKHSHSTLTLSTTAQAYDGTHTLALPSTDPYTSARTPASHMHGNIQNDGTLQTTDVSVANGDKLVVTDASNSNKVARTSVTFDGSTTTTALTPKGTFETFLQSHQDISGKEDKSNKVTAWQSTPDDTHYPSEKLVKNELDTKVPTTTISVSVPGSSTRYVKMSVTNAYHHYLVFFNASMGALHAEWLFRMYGVGGTARTTVNYIGAPVTARKWYVAGFSGLDYYIEFVNDSSGSQTLNFKVCSIDISALPTLSVVETVPSGYVELTVFGVTPASHAHGNITNAGALQTTDVAIASGDKLVITDSSNSNKIARTSTSFDGSTTTKALTQKGTFETFYQKPSGGIPDSDIASASTWSGKQDALTAQTAYSAKGSATKVPQITTNSLGQVTGITEVTISGVTPASHTHGNITNAGGITASGVTIANGDSLAIVDSSDTNKVIAKSSITFDGSTTTKALTQKGTFETFYQKPSTGIPDSDIASASTWSGKQDALTAQTAYSAKGSATKVPQITTNSLGQVTGITEVTITGVTPASHTHGNITNAGGITATGVAIANGDSLVIVDSSETNKLIKQTSITFDGSTTTKALTQKGTFETFQTAITYMTTAQETAIVTELGDL